jgi:hypothetical protein
MRRKRDRWTTGLDATRDTFPKAGRHDRARPVMSVADVGGDTGTGR